MGRHDSGEVRADLYRLARPGRGQDCSGHGRLGLGALASARL